LRAGGVGPKVGGVESAARERNCGVMSPASAGVVNAAVPKVNVPARDAEALPVGEAASRPRVHSNEVAVDGATADVDGAVGPSLAERDSVSPGIGARIAQEID